ncbi:MAG: hypothetical protein JWM27_5051 [Gemmatimonadetes bacterium]|nr:hypothetical protein [Gemmatimonadota bacterium]
MIPLRRIPRLAALGLAAAAALGAARPLAAQSLLASRGLGFSLDPLDARARGMGGIGLGLPGRNLSLVNPAEDAFLPAPTLVVAFQPDQYDGTAGASSTTGRTQRFPLIHAAFPFAHRFAGSLGYGAFLDQHWQTQAVDSAVFAGEKREINDRFSSSGGIARLRLGAAYRINDHLSVGTGVDLFTGSVRDSSIHVVSGFAQTVLSTTFAYTGVGYSGGVRWSPSEPLAISAAVSGGAHLKGEADGDSTIASKRYDMPLSVDAGASGRVGGSTVVALSGRWTQWSKADAQLAASGGARDVKTGALGLEYDGFRLGTRAVPLRLGAHYSQLPFRWESTTAANTHDFPNERALSAGAGFRLAGGAALGDLAIERGKRGGGGSGMDESYWRLALSLTLLAR